MPSGIYPARPHSHQPQSEQCRVCLQPIDVIHCRKTDSKRLHGLDEEPRQKLFSEKRVELLKELSGSQTSMRLASALAPSIYEHEDIKEGNGLRRLLAYGQA